MHAGIISLSGTWDIVNNTGQPANDFHIDATSDSNLVFVSSVNGAFGSFSNGQSIYNSQIKKYDWSDGNVAPGDDTTIGLELKQETFNKITLYAYWTKNGNQIGGAVPLPGFSVVPPGGNGPATVTMDNMTFNPGGLGTSVPDFTIPADSSFDMVTGLQLDSGDWLLWQGQVYSDAEHTDLIASFVDQHEHDTPEPASLLLLGACLLIAAAWARKRGSERP
jgi:hypothetical protein